MDRKRKFSFYLLYSLFFAFFAGLIVWFYYSKSKTMIDYNGDGFRQHYRALVYYSSYLKKIFANFANGNFHSRILITQ